MEELTSIEKRQAELEELQEVSQFLLGRRRMLCQTGDPEYDSGTYEMKELEQYYVRAEYVGVLLRLVEACVNGREAEVLAVLKGEY